MRLEGIFLPLTTPFDPSGGEVDEDAFVRNLRAWHEEPLSGVVVGGSTGEAPLLEREELVGLVGAAAEHSPPGRVVIAGTGHESTRATLRASIEVAAAGADAVLVRPPAYYAGLMTDEALRSHFLTVADASPVPVVLYHVPKYVPVGLPPPLAAELARHENVVAIKDSSGDIQNLGALCEACAGRAEVLVGAGTHLYSGLEIGAVGGIVAVGLLASAEACELVDAWRSGRPTRAGELQQLLGPLHRKVVSGTGVPGLKHALDLLGFTGGPPRPPLRRPSERVRREIARALDEAGLTRVAGAADA